MFRGEVWRKPWPRSWWGRGKLSEQQYEEFKVEAGGDYKKLEAIAQQTVQLNGQELSELYQFQSELKIINCFALVRGFYQFKEMEAAVLQKNPLIPFSPEKLLLSGVKTHFGKQRIEREFAGIDKKQFQVKPGLSSQARLFGFGPKEVRWMNQLGKEFNFASGVRISSLKPEPAMQTLLALYLAGYFELEASEEDFPLGSAYAEAEAKQKETEEKKAEERKRVEERAEKKPEPKKEEPRLPIEEMLDKQMTDKELIKEIDKMIELVSKKETTFFEILGVTEQNPPTQVKKIYFKMARIFHPDAKPALYQGVLRDKVEDLFTRISEAYTNLTEPEMRSAYLDRIRSKVTDEEMEQANRAIQAEMEFSKAAMSLRRGAFREAMTALEAAAKLMPDEPEYRIHLGYCLFKTEGSAAGAKAAKMIEAAMKDRPKVTDGWFYLGVIARTSGDLSEAKQFFSKALELDKYHQEAQRELRVIEMKLADAQKGGKRR